MAVAVLLGAVGGACVPKSDCEKARDKSAYARQGAEGYRDDYIRACEDGHRRLGEIGG